MTYRNIRSFCTVTVVKNTRGLLFSLTGRHHPPLADTFPDPAGRHSPGPAVLFGLRQRVRGRGGVVVRHQVSVVRHKVAPQLVKVLHRGRQEELHSAEDVQQRLQKEQTVSRGSRAQRNDPPPPPPGLKDRGGNTRTQIKCFKM